MTSSALRSFCLGLSLVLSGSLVGVAHAGKGDKPRAERPLPASYAHVEGHPLEGQPLVFTPRSGGKTKILYFHGAEARTGDGIIERLAPALHAAGVKHEIISMPHESNARDVERLIANAKPGSLILAAHSAGGAYVVYDLLTAYADKVKAAFLLNPAALVRTPPVPTFLIRGTQDSMKPDLLEEGGKNVVGYAAEGSDHSLRFRRSGEDRELANKSPQTAALVATTAGEIARFLAAPSTIAATSELAIQLRPKAKKDKKPKKAD